MQKNHANLYLILLFFLSGFCNLVYEIVWVRMLNLVFGVTVFAVSAVLASFMLGLAAGSIGTGVISEKVKKPALLFSLFHAGIFLSAVAILPVFPAFTGLFLFVNNIFNFNFYVFRIILFLLSLILLLVPTVFMGGTFPIAVRLLTHKKERFGRDVGVLYAFNTMGSIAGCLVTVFLLLENLGMKGTVLTAAFVDFAIAMAALALPSYSEKGNRDR